jgi:GNAT superfamily N-acetyltransferase
MDDAAVKRLEEVLIASWPAAELERRGRWVFAANRGVTGRANSVSPLGPPDGSLQAAIDAVEEWYRARGQPAMFRLTPLAGDGLVSLLEARGYHPRPEPTDVLVGPLAALPAATGSVVISDRPPLGWFDVGDRPVEHRPVVEAMMRRVSGPVGWATLSIDERTVAVGQGAVTGDHLSVFGMHTAADRRGRGHARVVLEALHAWGVAAGAEVATLQVTEANAAAQHLYRSVGYTPAYSYRYLQSSA